MQVYFFQYRLDSIYTSNCLHHQGMLLVQVIQIRNSTHEHQINSARFIVKKELLNRPYLLSKQQQICIYFLLLYFFLQQKMYLYLDQPLHAHKKPSILIHSDFYYICMYIFVIIHFFFQFNLTLKHFDLSKPQHVPLFQISLRTVE